MNSELADTLRMANLDFQEFIDEVSRTGVKAVESREEGHRLGRVELRLKQISQCLAETPKPRLEAPEIAGQILTYRAKLNCLRDALQALEFKLKAEKARLENVRANQQAASAWAASVRDIY
jgi:hypothetical protein